ncbi:MAG: synthase delta subunit [Candidatus Acidoferrum typicum]|nr:synthase delta subunit [Candidatus Acidoferrum typicum]
MKSVSLQYANALADIALTQGAAEAVTQELTGFSALYAESAELRNFLSSPAVTKEAKHRVIEKLLGRVGGSKIVRNFLLVVVDHQRAHFLPEIVAAFQQVVRQRQGITEAQVSSAVELNDPQKAELESTLGRLTGKRVEAKFSLEPELLGGAVVRVGDTVYDGSLRSRLNELRARLVSE